MPVLTREPFVFPAELLEADAPRPSGEWWVLHTKPRAEKAVARKLLSRRVGFFLPLHDRPLASRGDRDVAHHPLFPSYVFLHGDAQARLAALETNQLVQCIPVVDQDRLWNDLTAVHRLLGEDGSLRLEPRLVPGQAVEIAAGPLEGMRGKLLRRGGRSRFVVEVQMLGQGVSVDIDDWMVQGAD